MVVRYRLQYWEALRSTPHYPTHHAATGEKSQACPLALSREALSPASKLMGSSIRRNFSIAVNYIQQK